MRAFNPISKLCIFHAAALLVSLILFELANWLGWVSPSRGLWRFYDVFFWCVVTWPVWFIVVLLANRAQRGQVVVPLIIGLALWIFPALLSSFVLLVMHGQRH